MGGKPSTQRAASLALDGEKNLSSTGGKLVEVGKNICLSREEICKRTVRTHKRSVRFSVRAVRLYVRALRSQDYPDIDKFLYALRHTFCAHFGKFLQASRHGLCAGRREAFPRAFICALPCRAGCFTCRCSSM